MAPMDVGCLTISWGRIDADGASDERFIGREDVVEDFPFASGELVALLAEEF